MTTIPLRGRVTLSIPEAGRLLYGIGRDAAYAAADRGEIPTRRLGRTRRVPTSEALKSLGFPEYAIVDLVGLADGAAS